MPIREHITSSIIAPSLDRVLYSSWRVVGCWRRHRACAWARRLETVQESEDGSFARSFSMDAAAATAAAAHFYAYV